jgi:hypothetical protein
MTESRWLVERGGLRSAHLFKRGSSTSQPATPRMQRQFSGVGGRARVLRSQGGVFAIGQGARKQTFAEVNAGVGGAPQRMRWDSRVAINQGTFCRDPGDILQRTRAQIRASGVDLPSAFQSDPLALQ